MAYIHDEYTFADSIENEIKWAGNYGAKGEKRCTRKKVTPEVIAKRNQRNKENKYRRELKANFRKGDIWCTFTYPKGTRLSIEEVKADMNKFRRAMKTKYEKLGCDYKWIRRIEIGANGGIHCHMIINRPRGEPIEEFIQDHWPKGRVNFEIYLGGEEDARKLGDYLTKPLTENQLKRAEELGENPKKLQSISSSRGNLIHPVPKRKIFTHRTMRKIVEQGAPEARKGYYVDKSSVVFGVNSFTGLSYCYYTEIRADGGELP